MLVIMDVSLRSTVPVPVLTYMYTTRTTSGGKIKITEPILLLLVVFEYCVHVSSSGDNTPEANPAPLPVPALLVVVQLHVLE